MNERIHRYLDGELERDALTADERSEAAAYEEAVRRCAAAASSEPVPDMTSAVMERIAHEAPHGERELATVGTSVLHRLADLASWMWAPRPIRLRPAYGFVAVAVLLVALFTGLEDRPGPWEAAVGEVEPAPAQAQVFVQFRLDAPDASSVHLAGTFTGWEPAHTLHESAPGVWSLLVPLEAGVHEYAFVIDGGEWKPDPVGPRVSDGFGGENSRVTVLLPNGGRSL